MDVPAPGAIGDINALSKGCGSVMRSAPFGLSVFDPFETAGRCSYLTHGHPTASLSAGAFASIGLRALPADCLDAVEGRPTIVELTFDLMADPSLPNNWADRYPS